MVDKLANRVRSECLGIFYDDYSQNRTFGENEVNKDYAGLCLPQFNYPKWDLSYWLAPKRFREMLSCSITLSEEELTVFHYPVNLRKLKKEAKKREEMRSTIGKPKVTANDFLNWFNNEYKQPTCVYTNVRGEILVIGSKDITQEVMDLLKKGTEGLEFLRELTRSKERTLKKFLYLCDLVNDPKETYQKL